MIHIHCESCGDNLIEGSGSYKCPSCGRTYVADDLSSQTEKLKTLFGEMMLEQKEEQIANLRRELWKAIHEEYIDSVKIVGYCREIKKLLPDDFQAEFYDAANSGNAQNLNKFLDGTDTQKYAVYIPDMIEFMLKSLSSENLLAVNNLIERAYKQTDLLTYDKYTTMFAEEVAKVDECVYDVTVPRDVFVAYSSADMNKVSELVEVLESEGLSCFVAMRNLQHGRGAVANYERRLQEAIDNCKTVVLVSSVISRTRSDARKVELPYIRKRDMDRAPSEYSSDYGKMPAKYKKPRVEYLIEQYKGMAAESYVKEFFTGYEYRYSPKEVAEAIFELLAHPIEETSERDDELKRALDEQRKMFETMLSATTANSGSIEALLTRAKQFAEAGDYKSAIQYYNKVLDHQAENAEAWFGLLFAENGTLQENLEPYSPSAQKFIKYESDRNYQNAVKYATGASKERIEEYTRRVLRPIKEADDKRRQREEEERRERAIKEAERRQKDEEELRERAVIAAERRQKEEAARLKREAQEKDDALQRSFQIENGVLLRVGNFAEIKIPDNVTSIGNEAFLDHNNLTSVDIPSSVTKIGWEAFKNCTALTSITIPNGVTKIGWEAFKNCAGLTSITIPSSVTCIKYGAFSDCAGLTSVTIPSSITSLGNYTFSGCAGLTSLTIPGSIKSLEWGVFENCTGLSHIAIPHSVISMGEGVFKGCGKLLSVLIPDSLTSIENETFHGCKSLASITIPDSITKIGDKAFSGCRNLKSLVIPSSVKSIGSGAFFGCAGITRMVIPNDVTNLGNNVFGRCGNLTSIIIPDGVTSIGDFAFWNCANLTEITLPRSLTAIGGSAFGGCEKLTEIKIPNSVQRIGTGAFYACNSLTKVTMPKRLIGFMRSNLKAVFGANSKSINFTFT